MKSRILNFALATLAALASCLPGTAIAAPTKHKIQIVVGIDSSEKEVCAKIVDAMSYHIRSRQRFEVTAATETDVDHKVTVTCVGTSVQLSWVAIAKMRAANVTRLAPTIVRKIKLRREGSLMVDNEAMGLLATKELLRELPWEGEAIAMGSLAKRAKDTSELVLGDPSKKYERTFVTLSVGYLETESIGNCVPFDLGTLEATKGKPKFVKIGEGLIVDSRAFSVDGEAYVKPAGKKADKIYFRVQAPDMKNSLVKRYIRRCRERVGEGGATGLTNLGQVTFPGLFSKELIELNMVRQRAGMYLGTMGTTNGLRVPYMVSFYAHNYVEIGDFFMVDGRVYRTGISSDYSGGPNKSEATFAEGFAGLRSQALEYTFAAGIGLMIDKINIPSKPVREVNVETGADTTRYTGIRNYKYRPAFLVNGFGDWDDYWAGLRIGFQPLGPNRYSQFNVDFNLRLTDTWFIGWDAMYESVEPSAAGDPGAKMINVGGHVGFTIRRARPSLK